MGEKKKENGNQILDNIRFSTTKLIVKPYTCLVYSIGYIPQTD